MTYDEAVLALRAAGCVFAEDEARLLLAAPGVVAALVARRVAGEPLEQVLGWADFAGVRVALEPDVFVPRQRTALLVEEAVRVLEGLEGVAHPVLLDLCCGSGAIGLAVATRRPVELWAADVEPAAVRCARRNLAALGGRVLEGDLFDPVPPSLRGHVDVLTANVPYVPSDAIASMPPEARDHEPRVTLDGGDDGLDVLRRTAREARAWLAPGGSLLSETSRTQVPAATAYLAGLGYDVRVVEDDERGSTAVVARLGRPGGSTPPARR